MSAILTEAMNKINAALSGDGFDGTLKFDIPGEGVLMLDSNGATLSDGEAQCTLKMDADVFQGLIDGSQNPMAAFMSGKIKLEGDMTVATKLSSILG